MTRLRTLALLASVCLAAGGCSSRDEPVTGCAKGGLATFAAGTLTLSTGIVTRAPWVSGPVQKGRSADPRNGQGYDAAVGYALAARLGFDKDHVTWRAAAFADVLSPGPKPWDVNVNQVTIRDDRRAAVDLSRPYYVVRQAVVTLEGRPAAHAASLQAFETVRFAVVTGSAGEAALEQAVPLGSPAARYPDLDKVRGAVSTGTQDALVTDFLTALRLDRDDNLLVGGTLVGVLPRREEPSAEAFGMVLAKGSPLTSCVNAAVAEMERDGTLRRLERKWLVDGPGWRWFE